jgi:A nuclease of the HNH/ENDO VII superfamily with conserved WHH
MPDFSLVPVDHQPDFSDVSLVPVDHDPFSADDMIQRARAQLASQPQRLATSDAPVPGDVNAAMPEAYQNPNVGLGAVLMRAATGLAALPQRAIDASATDVQHFGEDGYTPQAIGPAVETALMMTGGPGIVPAGMIPAAKGIARGVAAAGERAAAIAKGELSANAPTGKYYSVWFETNLSPATYRAPRNAHYQEANENLLREMEGDADHARIMQDGGVDLQRTPTGLAPRTPPAGFTWHHAEEPGVMQLVPRQQHERGSIFQHILHPNGRGGYSKWGKPLSSSD